MGKNKNDLIEDRIIRNPMEQMRRKQKLKEKEKRKEQREFIRDQIMSRPVIDPLKQHDFSLINEIKQDQVRKSLGIEHVQQQTNQKYSGKSGVMAALMPRREEERNEIFYYQAQDQQKVQDYCEQERQQQNSNQDQNQEVQQQEGPTWQEIQNNYFRQLQGLEVQYSSNQELEVRQQREKTYRVQPYQMKQNSDQGVIAGQAIVYQQRQQVQTDIATKPQEMIQPKVVEQPPQQQQQQKQQQKKKPDFEDPLDPIYGEVNYRDKLEEKKKKQEEDKQIKQPIKKYQNVSVDIRKALGLDKLPQKQQAVEVLQQQPVLQQVESVENQEQQHQQPPSQIQQQHQQQQEKVILQKRFMPTALRLKTHQNPQNNLINPPPKQPIIQQSTATINPSPSQTPIISNQPIKQQQQEVKKPTIEVKKAPAALTSLLGNYSDSDDEDEDSHEVQGTFKLPGQDLMFASLIVDNDEEDNNKPVEKVQEKAQVRGGDDKKWGARKFESEQDKMSEELKKFMAELNQ